MAVRRSRKIKAKADLPLWVDTKSEWMWEKNLNIQKRIWIWQYRNLYQIQSQKNLNLGLGYLNFTKFQEKNLTDLDKIWMNGRSAKAWAKRRNKAEKYERRGQGIWFEINSKNYSTNFHIDSCNDRKFFTNAEQLKLSDIKINKDQGSTRKQLQRQRCFHLGQAWHLVVDQCGAVILQHLCVLLDDVGGRTALLIFPQLIVSFHNVRQLVGQIVLSTGRARGRQE